MKVFCVSALGGEAVFEGTFRGGLTLVNAASNSRTALSDTIQTHRENYINQVFAHSLTLTATSPYQGSDFSGLADFLHRRSP